MIVIESGGTKSSWCFLSELNNETVVIESVGLHPREIDDLKKQTIQQLLQELPENITGKPIFFYGAGCEGLKGKETIISFFKSFGFNSITVDTDLKGACLAILNNKPGYIGIIGTGAVAASFDGNEVIQQTSGLGHLIGDEGSGFDIGKRILKAYFANQLSEDVNQSILAYFGSSKDIIHRIYQPDGRKIIAGLTFIAKNHINNITIKTIILDSFEDYYLTALKPFTSIKKIGFIGSVAFYFKGELKTVLTKHKIELGEVYITAIEPLFIYHLKK
ncbi:MAG: hypothetical protein WED10_12090 [Brumimicrobium sp.]